MTRATAEFAARGELGFDLDVAFRRRVRREECDGDRPHEELAAEQRQRLTDMFVVGALECAVEPLERLFAVVIERLELCLSSLGCVVAAGQCGCNKKWEEQCAARVVRKTTSDEACGKVSVVGTHRGISALGVSQGAQAV